MSKKATNPFDPIEEAIAAITAGEPVIVTDDESRENEGDLIIAAEKATPEIINMMIRHARGLVCVSLRGRPARPQADVHRTAR